MIQHNRFVPFTRAKQLSQKPSFHYERVDKMDIDNEKEPEVNKKR